MVENKEAMSIEDVGWTKEGHHVEECELVFMNQCRGRERTRQEMEGWSWGPGMETLESLQSQSSVHRKNFHFSRGEEEGGQATKEFWGREAGLHPEAGCRVSPVTPSHTTRYDRVERLGVASHPCSNSGEVITTSAAQNTNMLSL